MSFLKNLVNIILYKPLYNALIFLVWLIPGHSVGWAIIILTIIIRLILLPSSAKTVKIQKKIQALQPELDKIKEKYKNDKQAQAQAMMEFYQRYKVNPLGGCLPMLVQLPVLYVMYYVFNSGLDAVHYESVYAFMPHIDSINAMFFGINMNNPNLYLGILAGLLQFVQAKQMMAKQAPKKANSSDKDDAMSSFQNIFSSQMTYFFPIITVMIAMKLPSALALYWVVTTICTVLQQWWIYRSKDQDVTIKIREA